MTRNWRWLLKAAVSAGLLFLIFWSVPFSAIWVGHLLGILLFLFFARALDIALTLSAAGYTRSMLLVAGMLPLSIGGFGVREGGMILLLHPYGVAPPRAVALAFLLLGRDLIGICAGGWLELRSWLARRP